MIFYFPIKKGKNEIILMQNFSILEKTETHLKKEL